MHSEGFTDHALRFHHNADKISEATSGRDMPGVLTALNETLAICTGCHSVFKQRVVDETACASLAGQPAPHRRDPYGAFGQALRIVLGAIGSAVGRVPVGNTGGSDVSMFRHMSIPPDFSAVMQRDDVPI